MPGAIVTDFIHIVGDLQHFLGKGGLKVPLALCGASLADPNALGHFKAGSYDGFSPCTLTPVAVPVCPACAQIAGWEWCPVHGDYEPDSPCRGDLADHVMRKG
jgi:hypothetical protein